jgi:hypothetical protein
MAQYKVRDQFYAWIGEQGYAPGTILDLDDDAAALVAVQVEPVEAPKPASKKAAAAAS